MNDDAAQRRAQALIHRRMLEENESVVVALNLAATTPDWLRALGAEPMKYGLDLRGGVHFLMEVDTAKNIAERIESTATDIKRRLRTDKVRYKAVDAEGDTIRAEFNSVAERKIRTAISLRLATSSFFMVWNQEWLIADWQRIKNVLIEGVLQRKNRKNDPIPSMNRLFRDKGAA